MSTPARRRRRRLSKLVLAAATLLFGLFLGEGVLRVVGGFRLFSIRLERIPMPAADHIAVLDRAALVVDPFTTGWQATRPELDIGWLPTSPSPLPRPPALDRPFVALHDRLFNYYVLNELKLRAPEVQALLRSPALQLPTEFMVFTPPGGKPDPHYRYPSSRTLPTGLVTNKFGFRGGEIDLDKPARTVRIAFVGASTTVEAHDLPHSAPELIGHWLSLWAQQKGIDVRFETINAAREAIRSYAIREIVAHEVMPLAVDYLVYYEGANQFQPPMLQRHVAVDGKYALSSPPAGIVGTFDDTTNVDTTWLDGLAGYLALAEYGRSALAGRAALPEPAKPTQRVTLPAEVMTGDFPLERAGEVLECAAIGQDLDAIRGIVEAGGAKLVLSTFWYLAYDGLLLDPVRGKNVHVGLNRVNWPFRYAVIRELADVQNRFFAAWAKARGVDLLDVGGELPQREELAIDAIHHNEVGVRLKAWIMFAGLTKILERDLAAGRVPRPDDAVTTQHPNLEPVRMLTHEDLGLK